MSLSLLHQFLALIATEKKVTRSTISAYDADLRDFSTFIADQPIENATGQDIQNYLLTQSHLAPSTVARRLSSLRQFYAFLTAKGLIKENPLSFVQAPFYKSKLSLVVNEEDAVRLLSGAKREDSKEGKRLSLLLHILSISDIPVNELVALPLFVGLEALKNGKLLLILQNDRIVPLTEAALEALKMYIMVHDKQSPWLFPSTSQKGHLTRQRFGQLLKELSLKVGLDPAYCSLHVIRRGFRIINKLERN